MAKKALIVVDMLNDFVHGNLKTDEAASTVEPARRVLEAFREARLPVFFVNDSHLPTDFEMGLWGDHAMKGTEGAEVVDELKPRPGEHVLEKHAYSAFYGTPLDYLLRTLGVGEVVLVGLDADICVRHTAADAFFRGYAITVVKDAVAARMDKNWEAYYRKVYGVNVISSDQVSDYVKAPRQFWLMLHEADSGQGLEQAPQGAEGAPSTDSKSGRPTHPMRALATGRKGFIGGCIFYHLAEEGHDVKGFGVGDAFTDEGFDAITHMAARGLIRESVKAPYDYFQDDLALALRFFEKSRFDRPIFVFRPRDPRGSRQIPSLLAF